MREIKVLHVADVHLEWPFTGMGADSRRGRLRREELKETFTRVIDLARTEDVQVLLIAGDLYEHAHAGRALMHFLDQQFRRIPHVSIFISPGNHDPLLPGSYYLTYPWPEHVHIFGPTPERVDLEHLPVSVYGWGFGAWEVPEYQLGALTMADPSRINLMLVHGGEGAYHPFRPADLGAIGADYVALGHIHKEGVVLEQGGRIIARYCGSPEPLSFGEPGEHGVYIGTVSKDANRLRFVPTALRQYVSLVVDVTGAVAPEEVLDAIRTAADADARQRHCYRITLTGAIDPELKLDTALLMDRLAPEFYFLKLLDATEPDYDLERLSAERGARGLFVKRMLAQAATAADPATEAQIRRALTLGLGAFEGRVSSR